MLPCLSLIRPVKTDVLAQLGKKEKAPARRATAYGDHCGGGGDGDGDGGLATASSTAFATASLRVVSSGSSSPPACSVRFDKWVSTYPSLTRRLHQQGSKYSDHVRQSLATNIDRLFKALADHE